MKRYRYWILAGLLALIHIGCEEIITVDLIDVDPKIVVEGSIENGTPPLIFLSRSFPFFGNIDINDIEALMLSGATMVVADGDEVITLVEYNKQALIDLSESDFEIIAPLLEQYLGFEITQDLLISPFIPDIPFYSVAPEDIDFVGEFGKNYWLTIQLVNDSIFGTTELTAQTYIPTPIELDSLWVEDHPLEEIDTLFQLRARLDDPDTTGNYYRVFNRANGGPWLTSSNSVFDDAFLDGASFPFTVVKGQPEREKLEEGDFDVDGYWSPGDTAEVKLCMIGESHYDFWRTVENERNNLGNPFGSFSVIATNIDGAVGIWGGYACTEISIVIPPL